VIWIATSNDSRLLTGPIRSRFREFNIVRPDAAAALASSRAVLKNAFAALQLVRVAPPSKELAVALAHLTPRQITQMVKVAAANAIQKGKNALDLDDLPEGICEELDRARFGDRSEPNSRKPKAWLH
jgi:AAA+ superfamily predicted ATPase